MQLLLETATEICSLAVANERNELLGERTVTEPYRHASHLTVYLRQLLDEAGLAVSELRRIVLSDGPGSYTSLRVGAATAKGLCLALGTELYTVPTLEALARSLVPCKGDDHVLATLNSRRGEVYGQLFRAADSEPMGGPMNVRLTDPRWRGGLNGGAGLGRVVVCGPGQKRLREALPPEDNAFRFAPPNRCRASLLLTAPALRRPNIAAYEPFYLNPPFVTKPKRSPLA